MFKQIRTINKDLDSLALDVQSLIDATASAADEGVASARKRLDAMIHDGERAYERLEDGAVKTIKRANVVVKTHPIKSLSVALGVGLALGAALYKRSR